MKKLLLVLGLLTASLAHGQGLQSSINWIASSSPPATPTVARLWVDSSNRPSWMNPSGFSNSWDISGLTATRVIVVPNAAGTLLLTTNPVNATVTNLDSISATVSTDLTLNPGSAGNSVLVTTNGTNKIAFNRWSNATTYSIISFNGAFASTTYTGMAGGGDNHLYLGSANGSTQVTQAGVVYADISSTGSTFYRPAIATTSSDGIIALNATASTSGVTVQYGPRLRFTGHAWNTTATAADNYLESIVELRPVSAATPTSNLVWGFRRSTDGVTGSFVDTLTLTSAGQLQLLTGTTSSLGISFATDVALYRSATATVNLDSLGANAVGLRLVRGTATSGAGFGLGSLDIYNGATQASQIIGLSDSATDSGYLVFKTKATGASLTTALTISTAQQATFATGATNPIILGRVSDDTTYGCISLNNSVLSTGMIGLEAGGSSDLYYRSQGQHLWRTSGGTAVMSLSSAGALTINGSGTALLMPNVTLTAGVVVVGHKFPATIGGTAVNILTD